MEEVIKAYDFILDLERLEDEKTTTLVQSIYEFYKLPVGKKSLSIENLVPDIGREYLIYSGFSEKYYLRTLKSEKEIEELKYDVEIRCVHLIWDRQAKEDIKKTLSATYKHYKRQEGALKYYKQYIPLIENTIVYGWYRDNNKDSIGYYTKCKQFEDERRKLINL